MKEFEESVQDRQHRTQYFEWCSTIYMISGTYRVSNSWFLWDLDWPQTKCSIVFMMRYGLTCTLIMERQGEMLYCNWNRAWCTTMKCFKLSTIYKPINLQSARRRDHLLIEARLSQIDIQAPFRSRITGRRQIQF